MGGFRTVRRELCDLLVDANGFLSSGFGAVQVLGGFHIVVPRSGAAERPPGFVSCTYGKRNVEPVRARRMVRQKLLAMRNDFAELVGAGGADTAAIPAHPFEQ